jgi:opacity protein-like surface antigen
MRRVLTLAVCAFVVGAPRAASAEILLTPFAGVSFLSEGDEKFVYGASLAFGGLIGVEGEIARTNVADQELLGSTVKLETKLTTGMVNLMVKLPVGPVHPYVTGGLGVIRVSGEVAAPVLGALQLSGSEFGMNFGGGVIVFPSRSIGLRGDVRYFRTLGDLTLGELADIGGLDDLPLPEFDFWRVTGGVTFRF